MAIGAAALNFRDQMFADGNYGVPAGNIVVPLSDGAGEVVEIGGAVTRVKVGDHVMPGFWPKWVDGDIAPDKVAGAFGAQFDGTLAEELVTDEQALTITPAGLSMVEAATIPCAGVTAWNALFVRGNLKPGATVLLLGTGGVSVWALQLAHAAGLRPIITSSSDAKLAQARALGAVETINYATHPEWQDEVTRLTDGRGVDLVVEVGGKGTMPRSVAATRLGGTVIVVGARAGVQEGGVDPGALIGGAKTLAGIMVGSRAMQEDLVRFIEATGIRPVIDRRFAFTDALDAYRHLQTGAFGKVVIDVTG
nr:NAD(P)-dependent alcohol dehydrogenase [Sphingomonas ginsenosidivorax]